MDGNLVSLHWNDHGQTFFSMLSNIRKRGSYTDVTLACDGRFYPAHRLVLSTCSEYFEQMFERTNSKHVFIVIANIDNKDLEALLNYMYLGEITVLQKDLSALMKAAESLRIKGLAEPTSGPPGPTKESKRPHEEEAREIKRKRVEERHTAETTDRTYKQPDPTSRTHNNTSGGSGGEQTWFSPEGVGESGSKSSHPDNTDGSHVDDQPLPPSPEVKMEEDVLVKDEPTSWYNEDDNRNPSTSHNFGASGGHGVFHGSGGGVAGSNLLPGSWTVPGLQGVHGDGHMSEQDLPDNYPLDEDGATPSYMPPGRGVKDHLFDSHMKKKRRLTSHSDSDDIVEIPPQKKSILPSPPDSAPVKPSTTLQCARASPQKLSVASTSKRVKECSVISTKLLTSEDKTTMLKAIARCETTVEDFMGVVNKKLDKIIQMLNDRKDCEVSRTDVFLSIKPELPVATQEDFEKLNENLEDPKLQEIMYQRLLSLGGTTVKASVKYMMDTVMKNDIQTKYNWEGRLGWKTKNNEQKIGFKKTKICSLITKSLLDNKNFTTSEEEISKTIMKYLRNAADRCGGRHRRREDQQGQ